MPKWYRLSEKEVEFFYEEAKRMITNLNDLYKSYRDKFPNSKRTDSGIRSQIFLARKGLYTYKKFGPIDQNVYLPIKRSNKQTKTPPVPINNVNISRVKATTIDNIMVDLIDAVSALKNENAKLREQVEDTSKQLEKLRRAANTLDAIKVAIGNMKEDI